MKKVLVTLIVCIFVSLAAAQAPKIVFANTTELLRAHPAGTAAAELLSQRDAELEPLIAEIQTLQQKSQTTELTAEERSRANLLVQTVEQVRQRYSADVQAASEPAVADINAALATVSQANGYTLVLDGEIAGTSGLGLVLYADPNTVTDITEQVITQMNAQ